MHILHIVATMRPETGGPAEAIRMMLAHQPAGYTSEVMTLDAPGENTYINLGPVSSNFSYSRKLVPWLRANRDRFDGVIVHGLWQYIGFAAHRTLTGRVPYVVFPHGMLDPYFKKAFPFKHLKKWPYWLLVEYWVLRGAYRVLFTTRVERDLANQSFWLHKWHSVVVPLGTEAPPPVSQMMREAFYERCPGVRNHRFLLFLGRIDPKKGTDLLLDAFNAAAHEDPALHLVVAGPNDSLWAQSLMARSRQSSHADRVHWPGMLQGLAKHGAFDQCEAFILPSHQENFGIAVVEALAAARPVLVSDKVNIAEEISANACGKVEQDTQGGTKALLISWMKLSLEQKHRMGLQAKDLFLSRYNMAFNTAAIVRVFESPASSSEAR